jgi:hypothetical protein
MGANESGLSQVCEGRAAQAHGESDYVHSGNRAERWQRGSPKFLEIM